MLSQSCLRIFSQNFFSHTCSTDLFFSCLWQNVYTIFSRAGHGFKSPCGHSSNRQQARFGGAPIRPAGFTFFHKMHFHQWELKCTLALFFLYSVSYSQSYTSILVLQCFYHWTPSGLTIFKLFSCFQDLVQKNLPIVSYYSCLFPMIFTYYHKVWKV